MPAKGHFAPTCKRGHDRTAPGALDKTGHCVACLRVLYQERRARSGVPVREKLSEEQLRANRRAQKRRYADENQEKCRLASLRWTRENKAYHRAAKFTYRYGMKPGDWERMFFEQGEKCDCCGSQEPRGGRWHVDHCHDTGFIRGIVCAMCNTGVGMFGDDPAMVEMAAQYLTKHTKERLSLAV